MTTCVVCKQLIKDRSTYIPHDKGPMQPICWETQLAKEQLAQLKQPKAR